MLLVGLTGGIGAGKSTVAGLLAGRGAVVVEADRLAREVVEPGTPVYRRLVARFGADIAVGPGGPIDRPALAARVFGDPSSLRDLNAITHPAIRARMVSAAAAYAATDAVVVLDIPLLKEETRDQFELAGVIVVDAPVDVAVDRLVRLRGYPEADARARIAAQMSRSERRRLADIVVDNTGTRAELEASLPRVWEWLEGLRSVGGAGGAVGAAVGPPKS